MNFANKLIRLRKEKNLTQEELAEYMNVTRQSVSKWESSDSIPDIEKIIKLSHLFNVSTDYLLKDNIESNNNKISKEKTDKRKVSLDEVNSFLSIIEKTSKSIAFAVSLCIISPITLFILLYISEAKNYISENIANGFGLIVLSVIISIAISIFIKSGSKTSKFKYLENETFEIDNSAKIIVEKNKNEYKDTYIKNNIIGVSLCIISLSPLFIGIMLEKHNESLMLIMVSLTLIIVSIGVNILVKNIMLWSRFEKLLEENDYSKEKKENQSTIANINIVFWPTITAIFLAYSFITNNWDKSWLIWPIACLLYYPIILFFTKLKSKKK